MSYTTQFRYNTRLKSAGASNQLYIDTRSMIDCLELKTKSTWVQLTGGVHLRELVQTVTTGMS